MRLVLISLAGDPPAETPVIGCWRFAASVPMETLPLSELAPATVARVADMQVFSEDATRLKAMGICVGRQVQMMQTGDPLILRVLGARVGLSARLAAGIDVVPIA